MKLIHMDLNCIILYRKTIHMDLNCIILYRKTLFTRLKNNSSTCGVNAHLLKATYFEKGALL
jgi:hypothetical protein